MQNIPTLNVWNKVRVGRPWTLPCCKHRWGLLALTRRAFESSISIGYAANLDWHRPLFCCWVCSVPVIKCMLCFWSPISCPGGRLRRPSGDPGGGGPPRADGVHQRPDGGGPARASGAGVGQAAGRWRCCPIPVCLDVCFATRACPSCWSACLASCRWVGMACTCVCPSVSVAWVSTVAFVGCLPRKLQPGLAARMRNVLAATLCCCMRPTVGPSPPLLLLDWIPWC